MNILLVLKIKEVFIYSTTKLSLTNLKVYSNTKEILKTLKVKEETSRNRPEDTKNGKSKRD